MRAARRRASVYSRPRGTDGVHGPGGRRSRAAAERGALQEHLSATTPTTAPRAAPPRSSPAPLTPHMQQNTRYVAAGLDELINGSMVRGDGLLDGEIPARNPTHKQKAERILFWRSGMPQTRLYSSSTTDGGQVPGLRIMALTGIGRYHGPFARKKPRQKQRRKRAYARPSLPWVAACCCV